VPGERPLKKGPAALAVSQMQNKQTKFLSRHGGIGMKPSAFSAARQTESLPRSGRVRFG